MSAQATSPRYREGMRNCRSVRSVMTRCRYMASMGRHSSVCVVKCVDSHAYDKDLSFGEVAT